jgi:hypothetical protein
VTSLAEYEELRSKVDAFADAARERSGAAMRCGRGCSACCAADLTVSPVEAEAIRRALGALDGATRGAIRARADAPVTRPGASAADCVMLSREGACDVYPARPLVCRTQGLPLRYPRSVVPEASVMMRGSTGDVTWCPLNFTDTPPRSASVLDAERVDQMLSLVNLRFAGDEAGARIRLRDLAR